MLINELPPDTASTSMSVSSRISFITCLLTRKARTPSGAARGVCGHCRDLAKGCNLGGGVRLRAGHLDNGAAESNTGLVERVILSEGLDRRRDRDPDEGSTANHRLEVRIDKFTNHDDLLQSVEWVNNIWLEANQCLTARVDA